MQPSATTSTLIVTTSWDDGHPSDLRVAELLKKHGLSGTFYVPCRNSEGRPVLNDSEITSLAQGFEIGGHTQDHVCLTELDPLKAAEQIIFNKHRLEDLLGHEVTGFAYVRGRYNRVVRDLVDMAGFKYARTVKNLTSGTGIDRLLVPTTTQFFPHTPVTYLRNFASGGPSRERATLLVAMLQGGLVERCSMAAAASARSGGYFHLWGHSWELDEFDLWDDLDRFLGHLSRLDAHFVTNADWCARVSTRALAAPHRNTPQMPVKYRPGAEASMRGKRA